MTLWRLGFMLFGAGFGAAIMAVAVTGLTIWRAEVPLLGKIVVSCFCVMGFGLGILMPLTANYIATKGSANDGR